MPAETSPSTSALSIRLATGNQETCCGSGTPRARRRRRGSNTHRASTSRRCICMRRAGRRLPTPTTRADVRSEIGIGHPLARCRQRPAGSISPGLRQRKYAAISYWFRYGTSSSRPGRRPVAVGHHRTVPLPGRSAGRVTRAHAGRMRNTCPRSRLPPGHVRAGRGTRRVSHTVPSPPPAATPPPDFVVAARLPAEPRVGQATMHAPTCRRSRRALALDLGS
jgi:hypothetical protein